MNKLTIKVDDLKLILERIFEKISRGADATISIEKDYYWNVSMKDAFVLKETPELAVGSLYDDWGNLLKLLDREQIVGFVEFDRMAAILKAISFEFNPI